MTREGRQLSRSALLWPRLIERLFFLGTAIVGWLLWTNGATVQRFSAWDVPIMLDGGWRVLQGQAPHEDFHSPLGPVTYWLVALGMRIVGPQVSALACMQAIVFVGLSIWAWALLRKRASPLLTVVGALCTGCFVGATSVVGFRFVDTGYAAIYNRLGFGLLSLVIFEAFLPVREQVGQRAAMVGGLSTGVAVSLLFFLKINYFGVGVAAVLLGAVLVPASCARGVAVGIGALVSFVAMLAPLHFNLSAVWADIQMGRAAFVDRPLTGLSVGKLLPTTVLAPLYMLFVLWYITPLARRRSTPSWISAHAAQCSLAAFIVVAQLALYWTNGQLFLPYLFPLAALLFLQGEDAPALAEAALARSRTAAWLLAAFPIGSVLLSQLASIAYTTVLDRRVWHRLRSDAAFLSASTIRAAPLGAMPIVNAEDYVAAINDGFDLLRKHSSDGEKILALNYTNPFSFGLLRPSPKGDAVWWDWFGTFARSAHPDPDRVFADAAVVIEPKVPIRHAGLLNEIYRPTLEKMFRPSAESAHWFLWRRKD